MINQRIILALLKKDIKAVTSSWQLLLPMLIVPLLFVIVIPVVLISISLSYDFASNPENREFVSKFLMNLPDGPVKQSLNSFSSVNQQILFLILNYFFIPLFLILPLMASLIIAASSFAGEKENKTLETLLFTPLSELELFLAKLLASFLPAFILSIIAFTIYCLIIDTYGLVIFLKPIFPPPHWLLVIFWLIPAISLLAINLCVFISARVKGFQESQQLSALLVLPFLILVFAQITGLILLESLIIFILGAFFYLVDIILLRLIIKSFNREKLFTSQVPN